MIKDLKNHRILFLILFIIASFYAIWALKKEPQKPHYKSPEIQEIKSIDNTTLESKIFLDLLMNGYDSRVSWISRKEIAAWSAIVLFFGILMILFQNTHKVKMDRILLTLFILTLALLFIFFVHQQFGVIYSGMAMQRAAEYWSYKTLLSGRVPSDFSFNLERKKAFPDSLQETVKQMQSYIRLYTFEAKILYVFPYWVIRKFYLKHGIIKNTDDKFISTIEVEESILYQIIIIVTFAYIYYYWNYKNRSGSRNPRTGNLKEIFGSIRKSGRLRRRIAD